MHFLHLIALIDAELRGSWFSQPLVAKALRLAVRFIIGALGFTGEVHKHCVFHYAAPDHQSGWQPAGRLVCTFKQYIAPQ